ncbi:hypothetical protein P620_13665 (plasmid) [Lactococcus lactis subsp. lactis KLDS 4.0325]|nr:hypothetical protein P620_13665 [Lactococcus lactis subsp. lactis KLDS 4.0325]
MTKTKMKMTEITPLEAVKRLAELKALDIPDTLKVVDAESGEFENDKNGLIRFGKLICADSEAYEALKAVGKEELLTLQTVKIKQFDGTDLSPYVGKTLKTAGFDFEFQKKNRFGDLEGVCFKVALDEIELA